MIFDRSAITVGRSILDFGLCDTKGVYQTTTKLRTRGWLIVSFLDPSDPNSIKTAGTLALWSDLPADKVTVLSVSLTDPKAEGAAVNFPGTTLWDFDGYVANIWGVNAVPTTFVVNSTGRVLARVNGHLEADLIAARALLGVEIKKAEDAAKAAAEAAAAATSPAPTPARA